MCCLRQSKKACESRYAQLLVDLESLQEKAKENGVQLDPAGSFVFPGSTQQESDKEMEYVRLLVQRQHLLSLTAAGSQLALVFRGTKAKVSWHKQSKGPT